MTNNRFTDAIDERREQETRSATVRAVDVRPEKVEWLWPGRVPFAMTTVLGGFPGVGKSTVLYDLAARVSVEGKAVLIVTAEDHLAAVVRPRLEAAGADLELVHIVTAPVTLPDGVKLLESLVRSLDVALVTLDPLVAFIDDGINTHRDHHVRRVLAPLADLFESTGAAGVVVIHTNKGEGNDPLMRISGSIGFSGAARSVLLAADDPSDETRRILAVAKSNLAEFPTPLAYRLVGATVADDIRTSRVEWLGDAPEVDVYELLGRRDNPEERSKREEAIEFLKSSGVCDVAQQAGEVLKDAKASGISDKTLQRARRSLGIDVWKDGFPGVTYWGPRVDTQNGQPHRVHSVHSGADLHEQGGQPPTVDTLDTVGGTPTLSSSSISAQPAETDPPRPEVDHLDTVGETRWPPLPKACSECEFWPHQGHSSACSSFGRRDLA